MALKRISAVLIIAVLVFAFQNCGQGFAPVADSQELSSLGDDDLIGEPDPDVEPSPTPTPEPTPEPTPVLKTYELPGSRTPVYMKSKLNWALSDSSPTFQWAATNLANQCNKKRTDFLANKKVVPIILDEGLLPGDPKIEAMKSVKMGLDQILDVAFCAYFAATPVEQDLALRTVIDYIDEWENIYVGDGNPINDLRFFQLFMAADLILPKMTQNEYLTIKALAQRMDTKEAAFMAKLKTTDLRLKNNWMLHHLMLRYHANLLIGNMTQLALLQTKMNQEVQRQYTAPTGFVLSTCANLKSVGVYGSFDLQQRDAFTYHAAGLTSIVPLIKLSPGLFTETSRKILLKAMEVMKPYVLNTKSHPEFICTTVQYDKDKIKLTPSIKNPWNPDSAKMLFRYARLGMPEISTWTTRYLTPSYYPWLKIYIVGKGDKLE